MIYENKFRQRGVKMRKIMSIVILILLLALAAGCSGSADEKIAVDPKPEPIKGLY